MKIIYEKQNREAVSLTPPIIFKQPVVANSPSGLDF